MKRALTISALLLAPLSSFAAVTITNGAIGPLRASNGSSIAVGSVGILVADFSNNGIIDAKNTVLSVNSFVGAGSDDQILGVFTATDLDGSGHIGFDFSGTSWNYQGNFGANDQLFFLWFPSISTVGATVGSGVSYGEFRSSSADVSADIAWIAPSDGQNVSIIAFGEVLGGSPAFSTAELTAAKITAGAAIPEPSSFAALAGLAMLGFAGMRKRRNA